MGGEGRWGRIAVIEEMIDLIGDDEEIVGIRQGQQLLAAVLGQGAAGGVLVGGDGVEEDGPVAGQGFLYGRQDQPIFIGRNGHGVEPVILLQDTQGKKVAGLFHEDGIAGAGEKGAEQAESLGRAGGDHQLLRLHVHPVAAAEKGGQRAAEAAVSLFEAVVEQLRIAFGEAGGRDLAHQCMGQEREIRLADAKVDHVRAAVDLGRAIVHGVNRSGESF